LIASNIEPTAAVPFAFGKPELDADQGNDFPV
jgi:hypothetical protein